MEKRLFDSVKTNKSIGLHVALYKPFKKATY